MSRISSFAQHAINMRNFHHLQRTYQERSVRATNGGKISDSYADFPYSSERIINRDVELQQLDTFNMNLKLAANQLRTAESSLKQFAEIMELIYADLISAKSGDETSAIASISKAEQTLEDVVRIGNTNIGGKYIFGKGANVAPINLSEMPTPNLDDPPDYSYSYVGNAPFRIITSRESDFFEYGVSVDTPAFENAIQGLLLMKTSDPTDQDRLTQALGKVRDSLTNIGILQTQLGQQINTVERIMDFNILNTEEYISAQQKEIMVDLSQSVSEFQDAEIQLKLSRQIMARIARQSPFED
jgi:flagellin-like hook-associated protein FlgL